MTDAKLYSMIKHFEGKQVKDIGHSFGVTFNMAFGTLWSSRRKQYNRRRFQGGFTKRAELDILFFSAGWVLSGSNGYVLKSIDENKRIRRELPLLCGERILFAKLQGIERVLRIRFYSGKTLKVFFNPESVVEDNDCGWFMIERRGHILKRYIAIENPRGDSDHEQ